MVTSQQQWQRRSSILLLVAVLAFVLLVGAAEACPVGYGDCDGNSYNGCETNIYTNVYNCGHCHYKCPHTWGPYSSVYCKKGKCYQKCYKYYYYSDYYKKCVHY